MQQGAANPHAGTVPVPIFSVPRVDMPLPNNVMNPMNPTPVNANIVTLAVNGNAQNFVTPRVDMPLPNRMVNTMNLPPVNVNVVTSAVISNAQNIVNPRACPTLASSFQVTHGPPLPHPGNPAVYSSATSHYYPTSRASIATVQGGTIPQLPPQAPGGGAVNQPVTAPCNNPIVTSSGMSQHKSTVGVPKPLRTFRQRGPRTTNPDQTGR